MSTIDSCKNVEDAQSHKFINMTCEVIDEDDKEKNVKIRLIKNVSMEVSKRYIEAIIEANKWLNM